MNIDLKYYLSILWRRSPYIIVVAAIFTSIGLAVAIILPPEYEAQATLLVESPQIPTDMASSTVRTGAAEQLQIIEQRLMTRANLIDIAHRLNVYGDEPMAASAIVSDMRRRTKISRSGRSNANFVTISFRAPNASLAAETANEFVTLLLQENVALRTDRAGQTLQFFSDEVDRLGREMDAQSSRILEFQRSNSGSLPNNEPSLRAEASSIGNRIDQIDNQVQTLSEQRRRLVDIFERTGSLGQEQRAMTPDQQALFNAQRQLDEARLVYAADNPKVKFLESRIALLESRVASAGDGSDDGLSPAAKMFNEQLAAMDKQVEDLGSDRTALVASLERVNQRIAEIPANSISLSMLERDYNNIQSQYNTAVSRRAQAATGERIEVLSKGERISVVEPATRPAGPSRPNRPVIAAAGAGVGLAAGFALVFLLEFLNRSIRRPVELSDRLGVTPIGVLPYIRTSRESLTKRTIILAILALLLIVVPALLFYIHSTIRPLDVLIEPYVNRLGLSITSN